MTVKKKPAAEVEPILYSMAQTAESLNVSLTTVYNEINKGELKTVRIGDRQFTTDEQRRAFIRRKQHQTLDA
jgi:excisionase family DNA binding protein